MKRKIFSGQNLLAQSDTIDQIKIADSGMSEAARKCKDSLEGMHHLKAVVEDCGAFAPIYILIHGDHSPNED